MPRDGKCRQKRTTSWGPDLPTFAVKPKNATTACPAAFLVDVLACYRLTRLIVNDTILDGPRNRLLLWSDHGEEGTVRAKVGELVECRWCVSAWVGFGVVAARRFAPRAWTPIATALAFSALAALGERLEVEA